MYQSAAPKKPPKKETMKNFLLITAFVLLYGLQLLGQQGMVKGVVTDEFTDDPLISATVYIEEESYGAVTDESGAYELSLDPGHLYAGVQIPGICGTYAKRHS